MKVKKLIERKLPFSAKYIYLDITRGSIMDGQVCSCDNCGKLITNMVHIVDKATNKQYYIGTDCAETFAQAKCLYNNGQITDFYVDIYAYNLCARVATELRKGAKLISDAVFCKVVNDKGKEISTSIFDMQKYFPDLLKTT